MNMIKFTVASIAVLLLAGCSDADIASANISKAADNFEVPRRVVLYNAITDTYVQEVIGMCSRGNDDVHPYATVTCKTSKGYLKHLWILGDNQIVFVQQLQDVDVNTDFYTVNFKPTSILPDIKLR